MIQRILIALDNSDLADEVISKLKDCQFDSLVKVIVVQVMEAAATELDPDLGRPHGSTDELYRTIEQRLKTYQTQLPYASEMEIVSGDPAEEIVRLANIHRVDLILLGSRGLKGVNRIVGRSVSSQVVAEAPCSVMVVRPSS